MIDQVKEIMVDTKMSKEFSEEWIRQERIEFLENKVTVLLTERKDIMFHYTTNKLDRLDSINYRLPYIRTELDNLREVNN